MWSVDELIAAPATPPGPGARAIVRLAGEGLARLLERMFVADGAGFPRAGEQPRVVAARLHPESLGDAWGELAVEILCWPGPGGPVGGPLAEVQLPASGPLVDAVIAEACRHGARLARGGEFSLRAFLAGRLDLVQAEAVLGVVEARSPEELASALDRMAGGAGRALGHARDVILDLLADVEAAIDFADETTPDAVPAAPAWQAVAARIDDCRSEVAAVATGLARRDAAATGLPRVVLVGPPNIGKSSLFNALVRREAALVADEAGTTRDWLEARLVADAPGGADCVLVDLAGIDDAAVAGGGDPASEAQSLARAEIVRADVLVVCRDAAAAVAVPLGNAAAARIDVQTRCDLADGHAAATGIRTSCRTGGGIDDLRRAIGRAVAGLPTRGSTATVRLAVACAAAAAALGESRKLAAAAGASGLVDEALLAGHLRRAAETLADVTGAAIGTDLLDRIFSRHCIGK